MKFYKLIKDILNSLRMEKAEFQRLTGINPVNITWWEQHPDTLPQMKTIKRIEQGLGILFEFDEEGRPTGWQKSDSISAVDTSPLIGSHSKEKVLGATSGAMTLPSTVGSVNIPLTPEELYEQFEVFGDKKEWGELSANDRKFYENLYQVFLLEIDEANNAYERAIDDAAIERAHAIEDTKQKIRRAMLNYMMGEFSIRADSAL